MNSAEEVRNERAMEVSARSPGVSDHLEQPESSAESSVRRPPSEGGDAATESTTRLGSDTGGVRPPSEKGGGGERDRDTIVRERA